MYRVNIQDAKTRLSALLERVAAGERILICNRNQPVAELGPVEAARTEPRPFGLARGQVVMPAAFFKPLPDDELDAFEGLATAAPRQSPVPRAVESPAGPSGTPGGRPRGRATPGARQVVGGAGPRHPARHRRRR